MILKNKPFKSTGMYPILSFNDKYKSINYINNHLDQ